MSNLRNRGEHIRCDEVHAACFWPEAPLFSTQTTSKNQFFELALAQRQFREQEIVAQMVDAILEQDFRFGGDAFSGRDYPDSEPQFRSCQLISGPHLQGSGTPCGTAANTVAVAVQGVDVTLGDRVRSNHSRHLAGSGGQAHRLQCPFFLEHHEGRRHDHWRRIATRHEPKPNS